MDAAPAGRGGTSSGEDRTARSEHPSRPWTPRTADEIASAIAGALERDDLNEAFRWVVQLITDIRQVSPPARLTLIVDEPRPCGDRRWDALLAGVVEHVCSQLELPVPAWTAAPGRFLAQAWFPVHDLGRTTSAALAVSAFTDSPAALANRGVFLHRVSLESV